MIINKCVTYLVRNVHIKLQIYIYKKESYNMNYFFFVN